LSSSLPSYKKNNKTVVNGKKGIWVVDKNRLLKHLLTKRMQFHLVVCLLRDSKNELVDNMDETQDDKYIPSLICFARKDFSEQYLMEGRA
jgi:hypothetical protein